MPILVAPNAPTPTGATDATSYSGAIRAIVDPANAGVRIFCDFSSFLAPGFGYKFTNPFRATVYRKTEDGVTSVVRSGDRVPSYGGIFHAYDDEPPLGQVVAYWAIPELDTSADYTPLIQTPYFSGGITAPVTQQDSTPPTSGVVAVKTWEPEGGFDIPGVWVKCLDNPDISMPVRVQDWSTGTYAAGMKAADVLGSPFPALSYDVRKSYATTMTIVTVSEVEYQQVLQIARSGVVYVAGLSRHRRRSGYYMMGDLTPTRVGSVDSPYDVWSVPLTQTDRPSTAGQSLVVPDRTFADRKAAHPFFSDIVADDPAVRATLAAVATARCGVSTTATIPVNINTNYLVLLKVRLGSTAAAARTLFAGLSLRDASNTEITVLAGDPVTVKPGQTAILRVSGDSAAAAQVRPLVGINTPAVNEFVDILHAGVYLGYNASSMNLLPDRNANFSTNVGDWVNINDTTLSYIARVGARFRDALEA